MKKMSLPPYGGSGLKFPLQDSAMFFAESPSIRREWIEMGYKSAMENKNLGLPPYGGSGLK